MKIKKCIEKNKQEKKATLAIVKKFYRVVDMLNI